MHIIGNGLSIIIVCKNKQGSIQVAFKISYPQFNKTNSIIVLGHLLLFNYDI